MEKQVEIDEISAPTLSYNHIPSSVISDYFFNEKYLIILNSLKSGYKPIEELYDQYLFYFNQDRPIVKDAQDTGRFILWDIKFKKKSKSTFYRWVNDLINVDLVSNAGSRINLEKNSLQKLYGLKAHINLPSLMGTGVQTNKKQEIMELVARLLNNSPDFSKLTTHLIKFNTLFENQSKKILEKNVNFLVKSIDQNQEIKKILEKIKNLDHFGYISIFFYFNLLGFLYSNQKWIEVLTEIKEAYSIKGIETSDSSYNIPFKNNLKNDHGKTRKLDYITAEPEKMMLISGNIWRTAFSNPKYRILFKILKPYPMTLKEIHFEYIHTVRKINQDRLKKNIPLLLKIQENTLYKYLVELRKQGLVIEVGRRIRNGQSFMEILYARSALFYNFDMKMSEESWRYFTGILASLFEIILGKSVRINEFHNFMLKIIQDFNDNTVAALQHCNHEELISNIIMLDDHEYLFFNRMLGLIYTLVSLKELKMLKQNLLNCYKD